MKNINKKVLSCIYVSVLILLLFSLAVIPGLNCDNQYINIGSSFIGIMSILFGYFYLRYMLYREDDFELFLFDELKEPETELDYNPDFLIGKDKKVKRKYKQSNRKQKTPA